VVTRYFLSDDDPDFTSEVEDAAGFDSDEEEEVPESDSLFLDEPLPFLPEFLA
jgi:hypothetical protein